MYIVGDGNSQRLFNIKSVFFCKIGLTISGKGVKGDNLPTGQSKNPPSKLKKDVKRTQQGRKTVIVKVINVCNMIVVILFVKVVKVWVPSG